MTNKKTDQQPELGQSSPAQKAESIAVTLEEKALALDTAAQHFSEALSKDASPFSSALILSRGISALRELLTDDIMAEIMRLADTPLGFMTDRRTSKLGPYKMEEVKDAIIEAALRGYRVAGNEFNIISSRFYAAKSGLHRKIITYPGVTDFKESFGVPIMKTTGATVSATATWSKDGMPRKLVRDIGVRIDQYTSVDAVIGKAQRKLYNAVFTELSGIATPDGDIDETRVVESEPVHGTKPAAPVVPDNVAGLWEGELNAVGIKQVKDGEAVRDLYTLELKDGRKAITYDKELANLAGVACGLQVKIWTSQGATLNTFLVESFETKPNGQQGTAS